MPKVRSTPTPNFDDTGRTENFDDPVGQLQLRGLSRQRSPPPDQGTRHVRDQRALAGRRQSATLLSGGPITGFGVGNPYDATNYHSYYICVRRPATVRMRRRARRTWPRRAAPTARMPWTYDVRCQRELSDAARREEPGCRSSSRCTTCSTSRRRSRSTRTCRPTSRPTPTPTSAGPSGSSLRVRAS